jgi:hypothetical protein
MTKHQFDKLDPGLLEAMECERQMDEVTDILSYFADHATTYLRALYSIRVAKSLDDAIKIAEDAIATAAARRRRLDQQ